MEWQDKYLSGPHGLVQLCSDVPVMWSIFHTVTFFERALKRSGLKKANWNSENSSTPNSIPLNPMASRISWMVTPLLKVCILALRDWPCYVSCSIFNKRIIVLVILLSKYFVLISVACSYFPATSLYTFPLVSICKSSFTW